MLDADRSCFRLEGAVLPFPGKSHQPVRTVTWVAPGWTDAPVMNMHSSPVLPGIGELALMSTLTTCSQQKSSCALSCGLIYYPCRLLMVEQDLQKRACKVRTLEVTMCVVEQ